jgi:hypothetical protein
MMSFESSDNIDISRNVTLNSSGASEVNTSHSSSDDTINVSNNMSGVTDIDNGNSTSHSQHRHGLTKAEIRKVRFSLYFLAIIVVSKKKKLQMNF